MNKTAIIDGIEYNLVPIEKKEEVKQQYKVGDWVVYCPNPVINTLRRIVSNNDYGVIGSSNLTDMYGDWMTEDATIGADSYIKPATKEQIETHLIQLAKKKGYDKAKQVVSVVHDVTYLFKYDKLQYSIVNDMLSDGLVSIYHKGKWAVIIKEEEKKFTFGGHEVKIENDIYNNRVIKCKNEEGSFNQLSNIILNPFTIQSFGNVCTKVVMTLPNTGHVTLTNNSCVL